MQPNLSIAYVFDFFGEDRARRLLQETGIGEGDENWPCKSFTGIEFWKLCVADLAAHNDEAHGCTHRPLPRYTGSMLFAAVNEMDTVKDGLQLLTRLLGALPAGIQARLSFTPREALIHYQIEPGAGSASRGDRYLEMFALVVHCVLRWGTGQTFRPRAIRLSDRLNSQEGSLLDGVADRYRRTGTGITVHYDRAVLSLPLGVRKYRSQDRPELSAFLDITLECVSRPLPDLAGTVEQLRALLSQRLLSKPRAAAVLGMSVTALQKSLGEAGTSFRAISQQLRRSKLETLLAAGKPLDDVAVELGFSDRRALSRACHQWLGMSPTQYREAKANGECVAS